MQTSNKKYKEIPVTFEKGLVLNVEDSSLDTGELSELLNWEPTQRGTLQARNAWTSLSTDGLPSAPYKVRGFGTIATSGAEGGGGSGLELLQTDVASPKDDVGENTLTGVTVGNQIFVTTVTSAASSISVDTDTVDWVELFPADDSPEGDYQVQFWSVTADNSSVTFSASVASGSIQHIVMYEVANAHTTIDGTTFESNISGTGGGSVAINVADEDGGIVFMGGGTTQFGTLTSWETGADVTGFTVDVSDANQRISHAFYAGADSTLVHLGYGHSSFVESYVIRTMAIGSAPAEAQNPAAAGYYIVIALAVNELEYEIYRILRDEITSGTWELIDTGTSTDTSAYVTMAQGAGYLNWSSLTMTTPRKILLTGPTGSDVTDLTNKAGRAYSYHKNRLFSAGSSANPSRLYFSSIGDPNEFATLDFLDIGGDDGEAIQDLISVEGLLLVCKSNRLYIISGSGIESFFVNELTGGYAAVGRAAVRTPYGTIVAGTDDVWVVQGGAVDPLSRPLGADYEIVGTATTAYAQDYAHILDSATGDTWRIDLVSGAWAMEEVEGDTASPGHLFSLNGRLYFGVFNDNILGGTRTLDSARSYDDLVGNNSFAAKTGKIPLFGPSWKYTPLHFFIQTRLDDEDKPNTLYLEIITDQGSEHKSFQINETSQRERVSLGTYKGVEWIQLRFTADASSSHASIDVEKVILGVLVENQ